MIKLRCVVEHITYQNPENGWSVMKVKVKGYDNLMTLTGSLLDVPVGSLLLCDGNWEVDARQYGLANYPELEKEGHWQRTLDHLHEKYAEGSYLRLWFENSPNVPRLNALREIIKDELLLREKFDYLYDTLTKSHLIGCTCSQCEPTKYRKLHG